jgi:hypothetical protein
MDQRHTSQVAGGNESGDVSDNASPRGNKKRSPVGSRADELPANAFNRCDAFSCFTVVKK